VPVRKNRWTNKTPEEISSHIIFESVISDYTIHGLLKVKLVIPKSKFFSIEEIDKLISELESNKKCYTELQVCVGISDESVMMNHATNNGL